MIALLMHLIWEHRAQSRGEIRANRLDVVSTGLPFPLVRELTAETPRLTSCAGLFANSMPVSRWKDTLQHRHRSAPLLYTQRCLALEKNKGRHIHASKGRRKLGYGAISPCPEEWNEVETWQKWLAAGWSPVSWVFQACPGGSAILSQV